MKVLWLSAFLTLTVFAFDVAADSPVRLDYPQGRYQENNPPQLFKWTLPTEVRSLTIKIYRGNAQGVFQPEEDLLGQFDVTGEIRSLNWPYAPFGIGHYAWVLEAYDDRSPQPLVTQTAQFEVEALQQLSLKSSRTGLQVGFSRGKYKSQDANYDLSFDTTPTTYGLFWRGGNEKHLWDVTATLSDFVLRGSVRRAMSANLSHLWQVHDSGRKLEMFLGPSLSLNQLPSVRSPNGTDLTQKAVSFASPGLQLILQRKLEQQMILTAQAQIETALVSSEKLNFGKSALSYKIAGGFLYGLAWPIGLGGHLQYGVDRFAFKDNSEEVQLETSHWSVIGNLIYGF